MTVRFIGAEVERLVAVISSLAGKMGVDGDADLMRCGLLRITLWPPCGECGYRTGRSKPPLIEPMLPAGHPEPTERVLWGLNSSAVGAQYGIGTYGRSIDVSNAGTEAI